MSNPLEALINNDPSGFKDSVTEALYEKLAERLELRKAEIAESLFESEDPEVEEDEFDEDDLDNEADFDEDEELSEDEDFEDEDYEDEGDVEEEDDE